MSAIEMKANKKISIQTSFFWKGVGTVMDFEFLEIKNAIGEKIQPKTMKIDKASSRGNPSI
ncbi:MAG: hypothetical protein OHK0038_14240 [Flammeovirgaceae bacterium]